MDCTNYIEWLESSKDPEIITCHGRHHHKGDHFHLAYAQEVGDRPNGGKTRRQKPVRITWPR